VAVIHTMLKKLRSQAPKHILTELLWFTLMLALCIIIYIMIFGFINFKLGRYDVNLLNTYFVFTSGSIISILFIPLFFFSLFIRAISCKFRNNITNILLIVMAAGMIVIISIAMKEVAKLNFVESGGVIYPPLSALPQENIASQNDNVDIFSGILIAVQLFLISILVAVCLKTGRNKSTMQSDQG